MPATGGKRSGPKSSADAAKASVEQAGHEATGTDTGAMLELDYIRGLISAVDESGIDSLEVRGAGLRIRIAKTPPSAGQVAPIAPAAMGVYPAAPAVAPAAAPAPQPAAGSPAAEAEAAPVEEAPSNLIEVTSPMVGTFYRAPAPEAPPYVEVGTRVSKGQTLCILEAMKLMNELEAEVDGVIREILVSNAEPVEYGQVLFRIEPSGS